MVAGNFDWLKILADSITAPTPLPSSFAPGAKSLAFITSETLESRCPPIIKILLSLGSVPRKIAIAFPKSVG